jgi:hypothetical protein
MNQHDRAVVRGAVLLAVLALVACSCLLPPARREGGFAGGTGASAVDDDFESYAPGDEAATLPDFTVTHGTSAGKLLTQVSLDPDGVNQCLNLTDKDIAEHYDLSKAFLHEYGIHETIPLKVWPVTAANDLCLVNVTFIEGGVDRIRLLVNQHDGVVKYYCSGAWRVTTGFTMTLDDWNWLYVKAVTDCRFNVSHDQATWFGPFNNSVRIDDAIDSISFESPPDNHVDGAPTPLIDEDYQTFAVDDKIRAAHGWDSWTEATDEFFKGKDSGAGNIVGWLKDNSGSENINPTMAITAHTVADGEYVEFDQDVISCSSAGGFAACLMNGANYVISVFVRADDIYISHGAGWYEENIINPMAGHQWTFRITRVSATTFKVAYSMDGGAFTDSATKNSVLNMDTYKVDGLRYRTQGSQTCEIYSRTIDASWTVNAAADTPAPMTLYVDDLGTNAVPDATFSGNMTTIVAGQSISFTHTGGHGDPPDSYQWYFGDGTANVTTEDVVHQFTVAGTHTVTLTMKGRRESRRFPAGRRRGA